MRLSLLAVALLTVAALPAAAQSGPHTTVVRPHHAGEAVRVTTTDQLPTGRARLDRYRGIRVYRTHRAPVHVVQATPAARTVRTMRSRYVRQGGATYPVVGQ